MKCTGGAGCLDCVTPFSSKMSFDIFIYLLLWGFFCFFFPADGPLSNHTATKLQAGLFWSEDCVIALNAVSF